MSGSGRGTVVLGGVLLGVPLCAAVLGPLAGRSVRTEAAPLLPPGAGHPLGTDVLGRDVLALLLSGGGSILLLAGSAVLLASVLGVPLALLTTGRRGAILVRLLDFLLALPGLLVLLVLAATGWRDTGALVAAIAVLHLPAVVRIARGAALAPGCRAAVEAMLLQGEPWWRVHLGYVGRAVLGPVLVDAASRLTAVLYLVASANFLGLGSDPAASDWAVVVERNRQALFLQPVAVLAPAVLLVCLCTGINLLVDRVLHRAGRRP